MDSLMTTYSQSIPKKIVNQVERYIKKVYDYNDKLQEYINETNDNELPDIDSTCVGFSKVEPMEVTPIENGYLVSEDGLKIELKAIYDEEEQEWWVVGYEGAYDCVKDSLSYNNRRLNKAWKIWRSDNPDAELENENEEE